MLAFDALRISTKTKANAIWHHSAILTISVEQEAFQCLRNQFILAVLLIFGVHATFLNIKASAIYAQSGQLFGA